MGADLYFLEPGQTKVSEKQKNAWLTKNEEVGYYRDAYNAGSTLWKLDLSWWDNVAPLLDDAGNMDAEGAKKFLAMIEKRRDTFDKNLAELSRGEGQPEFYREDLAVLERLIRRVIGTPGSKLHCWL